MKTVIHVALEVVRAMKPRANADEGTTRKPFRAVGSCTLRVGDRAGWHLVQIYSDGKMPSTLAYVAEPDRRVRCDLPFQSHVPLR
jgi:hypothetical protein